MIKMSMDRCASPWKGPEKTHEDGEEIHEIVPVAHTVVCVGLVQHRGELVRLDVGLAVLAAVAEVVDKHRGRALQGVHLTTLGHRV